MLGEGFDAGGARRDDYEGGEPLDEDSSADGNEGPETEVRGGFDEVGAFLGVVGEGGGCVVVEGFSLWREVSG